MKSIFYVIYIIILFGLIYFYISSNQSEFNEVTYNFPEMTTYSSNTEMPISNFLSTEDAIIHSSNKVYGDFYLLKYTDALYFSAATFFTGAYGDIIPKGTLKLISMLQLAVSYFLQLFLFSFLTARMYDWIKNIELKNENIKKSKLNSTESFFSPDITRLEKNRKIKKSRILKSIIIIFKNKRT